MLLARRPSEDYQSMGQLGRLDEVNLSDVNLSDSIIHFLLDENLPRLSRHDSEKITSFLSERLGRADSPRFPQQQQQQQPPTAAAAAARSSAVGSTPSNLSFMSPGRRAPHTSVPGAACHPPCTANPGLCIALLPAHAPIRFPCCWCSAYLSLFAHSAVPYREKVC
jgi:hypothetical protein